jgi:hypothetical protein
MVAFRLYQCFVVKYNNPEEKSNAKPMGRTELAVK